VEAWLNAPAHRDRLLDPAFKSFGLGLARDDKGNWLTVLDWLRDERPQPPGGPVLYPGPAQAGVPLLFPGNEIPDPLPHTKEKLTGYPITVTFPGHLKLTSAAATLEDEAGKEVEVWFSAPEKPANDEYPRHQMNTLCLFARQPFRPGTRYVVRAQARAGNQPWMRTWSFTTIAAAKTVPLMLRRALERVNEVRKDAGLDPVQLDAGRCKGCTAHAAYLARHLDRTPGVEPNKENPELPGYTAEGDEVAKSSAIRLGGRTGPADAIDWMLASVLNRHLILNPSLTALGMGVAPQSPRGWIWVIYLPGILFDAPGDATLYPGKGQKDVPLFFGREVSGLVEGAAKDHVAGFAVTANFAPRAAVRKVTARLRDAAGNDVAHWLSTPEKPLPGTGRYAQVLLIPRRPLAPATTYTVSLSAEVDGAAWSRAWSFTTTDPEQTRARVAAGLLERVNVVRRHAGLAPVTLDEKLSAGCLQHARYVVRNLSHPKAQGLHIHDEFDDLPGATPEGKAAGKASVIALISDPGDSVDDWMATLYHRIPLLEPGLKRIGYAQERHPIRGWITVLDAGSGR
jgi:uncharacterized protein YkwD